MFYKKIIVLFIFAFATINMSYAQTQTAQTQQKTPEAVVSSKPVTAEIKVSGNCAMCKRRIEEACVSRGVKSASWDKNTGILTVSYNPKATSVAKISANIAKRGHDVAGVAADPRAYTKLPECCQYRTGDKH